MKKFCTLENDLSNVEPIPLSKRLPPGHALPSGESLINKFQVGRRVPAAIARENHSNKKKKSELIKIDIAAILNNSNSPKSVNMHTPQKTKDFFLFRCKDDIVRYHERAAR